MGGWGWRGLGKSSFMDWLPKWEDIDVLFFSELALARKLIKWVPKRRDPNPRCQTLKPSWKCQLEVSLFTSMLGLMEDVRSSTLLSSTNQGNNFLSQSIYRRLSRCICSQGVQGSVYPVTHKGGKAVSHSVRYSDTLLLQDCSLTFELAALKSSVTE